VATIAKEKKGLRQKLKIRLNQLLLVVKERIEINEAIF
jgi:hypothetical protein